MRTSYIATSIAALLAVSACTSDRADPNRTARAGTSADTVRGQGSPAAGTTAPLATTGAAGVHGSTGSTATTGVPATTGIAGTTGTTISGTPAGRATTTDTTTTDTRTLSGTSGIGTATGTGMLTAADRAFLHSAAHGGMAEVELARMAQQKTSSSAVRDLAQRIARDHTQANQELMQIASRYGVTPASSMDPSHRAVEDSLQPLSGAAFDRQYLEQQYADHAKMLTSLQMAQRSQTPEVSAFAQRTAPVIQQHLDQIRSIWPTATTTR